MLLLWVGWVCCRGVLSSGLCCLRLSLAAKKEKNVTRTLVFFVCFYILWTNYCFSFSCMETYTKMQPFSNVFSVQKLHPSSCLGRHCMFSTLLSGGRESDIFFTKLSVSMFFLVLTFRLPCILFAAREERKGRKQNERPAEGFLYLVAPSRRRSSGILYSTFL